MARGRFITFEGGEGAGKSTQLRLLAATLEAQGTPVVTTREPGGAPGAEEIRRLLVEGETGRWDPLSEVLLHYAARREHLVRTVWPALEQGRWVLSDRFADSTLAYQGSGHGLPAETIKRIHRIVVGDFGPDLTLILDLPVEAGLARAAGRAGGEDRYERMGTAFHERLRRGFLDIAKREPQRCVVVPAGDDVGKVQAEIWRVVSSRLGITA
jgi:dTMP kinase